MPDRSDRKLIANKKRVQHIYRSVNRDVFETALMQVCGYLSRLYIDEITQSHPISDANRELIIGFTVVRALDSSWTG